MQGWKKGREACVFSPGGLLCMKRICWCEQRKKKLARDENGNITSATPLSGLRGFYEILPLGPCGNKLGLNRLARMLTKCWKKWHQSQEGCGELYQVLIEREDLRKSWQRQTRLQESMRQGLSLVVSRFISTPLTFAFHEILICSHKRITVIVKNNNLWLSTSHWSHWSLRSPSTSN